MIDAISFRVALRRPSGACLALGVVVFVVFAAIWCVADSDHHTFGHEQGGAFCTLVLLIAAATIQLLAPTQAVRVVAPARPLFASRSIAIIDPPPKRLLSR